MPQRQTLTIAGVAALAVVTGPLIGGCASPQCNEVPANAKQVGTVTYTESKPISTTGHLIVRPNTDTTYARVGTVVVTILHDKRQLAIKNVGSVEVVVGQNGRCPNKLGPGKTMNLEGFTTATITVYGYPP